VLSIDHSLVLEMPELHYGSVWLAGAGDGDLRHLSPLALHALGTADAVIHDHGIARQILDFVQSPRYREVASPEQAIERSIKLAEDGWRIVRLVEGDAVRRRVRHPVCRAQHSVPDCAWYWGAGRWRGAARALSGPQAALVWASRSSVDARPVDYQSAFGSGDWGEAAPSATRVLDVGSRRLAMAAL